jgi:hypothetical protein
MRQNTQNGTYITIKIHKITIKYTIYQIKEKHKKHTTIYEYTITKNGTKRI